MSAIRAIKWVAGSTETSSESRVFSLILVLFGELCTAACCL